MLKGKTWIGWMVLVCVLALGWGISLASVYNSPHDMAERSSSGTKSRFYFDTAQVCVFCHTPHSANETVTSTIFFNTTTSAYEDPGGGTEAFLLWNRALSNATDFDLYSSATMNATTSRVGVYSLLCLSCHDGLMALNVLSNPPEDREFPLEPDGGLAPGLFSAGTKLADVFYEGSSLGWGPNITERDEATDPLNLSNDHPISIEYPTADPGFDTLANAQAKGIRFFPGPNSNNYIECSSCHDPHNWGSNADGTSPFLRVSVKDSELCLACHLK
jgi:cytochrome c553